jgi:hypothetical protein
LAKIYSLHKPKPEFLVRKTRGAFFLVDTEFMRRWTKLFDPCTNAVYVLLCSMADKEQKCFPSMDTIRERVGFSKKSVMRSIRLLEFYRIVGISKAFGKVNTYWLTDKSVWEYPGENNELVRPIDFIML